MKCAQLIHSVTITAMRICTAWDVYHEACSHSVLLLDVGTICKAQKAFRFRVASSESCQSRSASSAIPWHGKPIVHLAILRLQTGNPNSRTQCCTVVKWDVLHSTLSHGQE